MAERITREQAHDILMKYMKGECYIQHSYAVEAIMKGLAKRLAPDEAELQDFYMIWMKNSVTGSTICPCMDRHQ